MKTLFIDTTRKNLSIVLFNDRTLVLKSNVNSYSKHSNYLMNEISNIMTKSNMNINDIDNFIVLNGPGSFTGIRVGVTVAKTLAWVLSKKLFVVNNLKAISLSSSSDYTISIISDKKNLSYVGIYTPNKNAEGYYSIDDQIFNLTSQNIELIALEDSEYLEALNEKLSRNNNVKLKITNEYDYLSIIDYAFKLGPINPHSANALYIKKIDVEQKNDN